MMSLSVRTRLRQWTMLCLDSNGHSQEMVGPGSWDNLGLHVVKVEKIFSMQNTSTNTAQSSQTLPTDGKNVLQSEKSFPPSVTIPLGCSTSVVYDKMENEHSVTRKFCTFESAQCTVTVAVSKL